MPIDDVADLIRRFEPVLFFHPDERFFPSDAKRYVENSAIWTVHGTKGDDKASWGSSGSGKFPRHPKSLPPISALAGEMGTPVDAALGAGVVETFLALAQAGWDGGSVVTADSTNEYANLGAIAGKYGKEFGDGFDKHLADSRFWYHAEIFDLGRLRPLVVAKADPRLLEAMLALPEDTALVCYYFFFPGSDGALEGCDGDTARLFDNFAGQWTCIAVLLEGTTPPGVNQLTLYEPKWLGMTSRAVGVVTTPQTEAKHFGMIASNWSLVPNLKRDRPGKAPGEHALVYVARQTHGFYLSPGPQPTLPLVPDDIARSSCGEFETMEDSTAEANAVAAGHAVQQDKNRLFKWFWIFGGPIGFFIGLGYSGGVQGLADLGGPGPAVAPPQFDHPPDAGSFGFVIRPEGIVLSPAQSGKKVTWPRFGAETVMTTNIDAREYSLMLGSTANPFSRPPWLPSDDRTSGFSGRWGNRVTQDPQARRAGMEFMDFWELFLLAFRKAQSMP
jgi:hypothetical protein